MSPHFLSSLGLVLSLCCFNTGCAFAEEPCSLVQLGQTWVDAIPDLRVFMLGGTKMTRSQQRTIRQMGMRSSKRPFGRSQRALGGPLGFQIAGGGSFATSESFDAANEYLANAYGKYGDEAEGKLALRVKSARNYAKKYGAQEHHLSSSFHLWQSQYVRSTVGLGRNKRTRSNRMCWI